MLREQSQLGDEWSIGAMNVRMAKRCRGAVDPAGDHWKAIRIQGDAKEPVVTKATGIFGPLECTILVELGYKTILTTLPFVAPERIAIKLSSPTEVSGNINLTIAKCNVGGEVTSRPS